MGPLVGPLEKGALESTQSETIMCADDPQQNQEQGLVSSATLVSSFTA